LDAGADDYVTKPFGMRELIARVRAMLRRQTTSLERTTIESGDIKVDLVSHNVWRLERKLDLTRREFNLLALFVQNRGRAFSRDEILAQLWGEAWIGDVRTVDVHVRWLREKIEDDPSHPTRLTTIRGFGYRFDG
jgi:DNA-binding response OmpR family regulator